MSSVNNYEITLNWFIDKKNEWNSKKKIYDKYPTIDIFNLYIKQQIQKAIKSKITDSITAYISLPNNNVFYYSTNPDFLITIYLYRAINQFKEVVDIIRFESNEISKIIIDNQNGEILSKDIWLKQLVNQSLILDYKKYSQGSYFKFPTNTQITKPSHTLVQDNPSDSKWYFTDQIIEGKTSYPSKNTDDPWYSVTLPFDINIVTHDFMLKEIYELCSFKTNENIEDFIKNLNQNDSISSDEKNTILTE